MLQCDEVDDTGIEPVTPTMPILTFLVLRLTRVLMWNVFTATQNLDDSFNVANCL